MKGKRFHYSQLYPMFLALFVIIACNLFSVGETEGTPSGSIRIESSDGSTWLDIPKNALPDDVDPESITITPLQDDELPVVLQEGTEIFAYSLEPDGLEFSEPVSLTITIPPVSGSRIFFGSQIEGENELSFLDITNLDINDENEEISVSIEITHFSKYFLCSKAADILFDLELDVKDSVEVDVPFKARAIISSTSGTARMYGPKGYDMRIRRVGELWNAENGWWRWKNWSNPSITPLNIIYAPKGETTTGANIYNSQKFTCNTSSSETLIYSVIVNTQIQIEVWNGSWFKYKPLWAYGILYTSKEVKCANVENTPTSTPTPTLPPTPLPTQPVKWIEDNANDPVCCEACVRVGNEIPKYVDIKDVSVQRIDENTEFGGGGERKCVYNFTITVHELPSSRFVIAAISVYDPTSPHSPQTATTCLEEGTNLTYYIKLKDGVYETGQRTVIEFEGQEPTDAGAMGEWQVSPEVTFDGVAVDNHFIFYIPCDELPIEVKWMAWTTNGEYCDEVGYR